MKLMNKFVVILALSFLFIGTTVSLEVSADSESIDYDTIEVDTQAAPWRIWWEIPSNSYLGEHYYFSRLFYNGNYRGYLSVNWSKSIGSLYYYEGYLYPEGTNYPIPAKARLE